jgi:hypothetical protein
MHDLNKSDEDTTWRVAQHDTLNPKPTCQNKGSPWPLGQLQSVDFSKLAAEDGGGEGREHAGVAVNPFWGLEGRWLTVDWLPMATQLGQRGMTMMGRRRGRGSW